MADVGLNVGSARCGRTVTVCTLTIHWSSLDQILYETQTAKTSSSHNDIGVLIVRYLIPIHCKHIAYMLCWGLNWRFQYQTAGFWRWMQISLTWHFIMAINIKNCSRKAVFICKDTYIHRDLLNLWVNCKMCLMLSWQADKHLLSIRKSKNSKLKTYVTYVLYTLINCEQREQIPNVATLPASHMDILHVYVFQRGI